MKEERIACHYCSELILSDAKKCRFCGEWLTPRHKVVNNYEKREVSHVPQRHHDSMYKSEETKSIGGIIPLFLGIGTIIFGVYVGYMSYQDYKEQIEQRIVDDKTAIIGFSTRGGQFGRGVDGSKYTSGDDLKPILKGRLTFSVILIIIGIVGVLGGICKLNSGSGFV